MYLNGLLHEQSSDDIYNAANYLTDGFDTSTWQNLFKTRGNLSVKKDSLEIKNQMKQVECSWKQSRQNVIISLNISK